MLTTQTFHYAARSSRGRVNGSIDAESRAAAIGHLRARSLFITALEPASTPRGAWAALAASARRRSESRAVFFRSFGALMAAGVAVKRALEALVEDARDPQFGEVLASIAADVANGMALSAAMQRHPSEFSAIAVATIKAGEVGGTLDRALRSVAELEERNRALRKRVTAALAYPAMVTLAAGGLVAFLVANTMPAFALMFAQMHVALPIGTRLLIRAAAALRDPRLWTLVAASIAAAIAARTSFGRSEATWAFALDRLRLNLPMIGAVVRKANGARFSRTLGSLLGAGVDLVAALQASIGVVESCIQRREARILLDALHGGESLGARLRAGQLFDGMFLTLVRAGEESGTLDGMLLRIAEYYELDIETALTAITGVLEPLLICVLGGAIGAIVASIIVPLYSLIGEIQ